MKKRGVFISCLVLCLAFSASAQKTSNPLIDMPSFLKLSQQAAKHRSTRRVTEDEFIRMSREAGVVILDARSRQKFDELHIRGAVNLLSTYISLYIYGYRNIYELGPLLDVKKTKLELVSSSQSLALKE